MDRNSWVYNSEYGTAADKTTNTITIILVRTKRLKPFPNLSISPKLFDLDKLHP